MYHELTRANEEMEIYQELAQKFVNVFTLKAS